MFLKSDIVTFKEKVDVIIPKEVGDQIKHLCKEISQVEWSGPLFYTMDGTITDPSNLKITLQGILPLDRGSAGATNYDIGLPVVRYMAKHEAPEKGWKLGHIHSHHNMTVYFSGVDESELHTNAENHNMYLSVIVNNKGDIIGKIGIIGDFTTGSEEEDVEIGYTSLDENGEEYWIEETAKKFAKRKFFEYECNIIKDEPEIVVSEEFLDLMSKMVKHSGVSREYSGSTHVNYYGRETHTPSVKANTGGYSRSGNISKKEILPSMSRQEQEILDDRIEFFELDLLANEDEYAKTLTTVEDIMEYYATATNKTSAMVANTISVNYQKVFEKSFENMVDLPEEYILRKVIMDLDQELDSLDKDSYNFLEPIIARLKGKLKILYKTTV